MTARTFHRELFPIFPACFADVRPPAPVVASAEGVREYRVKWEGLVRHAEALGLSPQDLATVGVVGLNERRVTAGLVSWSPRTISYYAKLVRYSGLAWDSFPVGDAEVAISPAEARVLWLPRQWSHAAAWRAAALCAVAWLWPAPPLVWLSLPGSAVVVRGRRGLDIVPPESCAVPPVSLPAGGLEWRAWLECRARLGLSDEWALCTTEAGKRAGPGVRLSLRGLQAGFARHARECGLPGLSYERYRVAAVAHGAPVVGGRGAVRAARRAPRAVRRPAS